MRPEYLTKTLDDPLYKLYLPLAYNNGVSIEEDKFIQTRNDLLRKFPGLSVTPPDAPITGYWQSDGIMYTDQNITIEILTPDDEDDFFSQYKQTLRKRFRQEEIHIQKTAAEQL